MAVNVNTVYRTVLLILNKEQRGYMTPDEFNKVAAQVQIEIFNKYFDDLNQLLKAPSPQTTMNYSDRVSLLDEKISIFKTSLDLNKAIVPFTISNVNVVGTNGEFESSSSPIVVGGRVTVSGTNLLGSNNGTISGYTPPGPATYYIIATNKYNTFTLSTTLGGTPVATVINSGTTYGLTFSYTAPSSYVDKFVLPVILRELGSVFFTLNDTVEVERLQKDELPYINKSDLTKPSENFPVYLYENNLLTVLPTTINSISINFIRQILNPVWAFEALPINNYRYDYLPANSTDFELHDCEQTNIITRILMYSGVIIKNPDIVQMASQQVQLEQINSKA
jgi:hypothetical protein